MNENDTIKPEETPSTLSDNRPRRVQITHKAGDLITGDRLENWGPPEKNFQRVADYWSIRLRDKLKDGETLTPREVAEMLSLLKVARATQTPTEDSFVDNIGYTAIAGELAEAERKRAQQGPDPRNGWTENSWEGSAEQAAWLKYTKETGGDGK